jgi:hypothetical protein
MVTETLIRTALPGTPISIDVPSGWATSTGDDVGLVAAEAVTGRFAASINLRLIPAVAEIPDEAVAATMAPLVAPQLLHLHGTDDSVEFLLCHLVGEFSVTVLQRQVLTGAGLAVVTVTTATSRWADLADLAGAMLDSLEVAA